MNIWVCIFSVLFALNASAQIPADRMRDMIRAAKAAQKTPVEWIEKGPQKSWWKCAMSANGGVQLACASGDGVYYSSDGGNVWTLVADLPHGGTDLWGGVAVSGDGTKWTAVHSAGYIYVTVNSGASWSTNMTDVARAWNTIAMSSNGVIQVAGDYGSSLYVSPDSGATWAAATSATSHNWTASAVSLDGTRIVAGNDDSYVYLSTNSGADFAAVEVSSTGYPLALVISADKSQVYMGSSAGYFYTLWVDGPTWWPQSAFEEPVTLPEAVASIQGISIAPDNSRAIAVLYGDKVYESTTPSSGGFINWSATLNTNLNYRACAMSYDGKKRTTVSGDDSDNRIRIKNE